MYDPAAFGCYTRLEYMTQAITALASSWGVAAGHFLCLSVQGSAVDGERWRLHGTGWLWACFVQRVKIFYVWCSCCCSLKQDGVNGVLEELSVIMVSHDDLFYVSCQFVEELLRFCGS